MFDVQIKAMYVRLEGVPEWKLGLGTFFSRLAQQYLSFMALGFVSVLRTKSNVF